ncbi:MAG: integral rane sensor signal transduction histidine kinase [Thermoleophilia bacterium]|nr:integral rane sensor signal transduction histidine kinase [Thermoleophilia bacterium]
MTTGLRFAVWATIAGSLAVLLAGVVALVVVDRTLDAVVDERLQSTLRGIPAVGTAACASIRSPGDTTADDRVVSIIDRAGQETCRSSPVAPSPRALEMDEDGFATAVVDGARWRTLVRTSSSGSRAIAAEQIEAHELARADARRAIIVAMVLGTLIAAAGGAIAAIPARRRIARLLERIQHAGRDRSGSATVGKIGGRDLDAAAASFDELLADVRASEVAQRRLVSDAAHQLRTPITSLRTNAQLLERQPALDEESRDIATRIARQAAAVSDLVSGLVDYTAISAWSGERRPASLGELAAVAIERARARWPEASFDAIDDGSTDDVDGELVVRALGNVLDNAVVHGGGHVSVEIRDGVVLVLDDGPGFTMDDDDVFRPFSSGGDGSGLGLAFVRHVARAHGGDAWIERRSPATVGMRFAILRKFSDSSRSALGHRTDGRGVHDEG